MLILFSPLAIWKTLEDWNGWTTDLFSNDTRSCDQDTNDTHPTHLAINHTLAKEESAQCMLRVKIIFKHFVSFSLKPTSHIL
jgi:hypothetical protein